ncbi:MAG: paraslipin [Leptolyngbyaceae cyanobacterium RU_5_1]|nr:paraslipin [Leptolyngbyaceae cyanobacterium RU_5_1]
MESLIAVAALVVIGYTIGSVKIINQGFEGIVERLGRYQRTLKPGLNFVVPLLDAVLVETTREQLLEIEPQSVITRDSLTIMVDAVLFWKILDVQKAYYSIENLEESLRNLVLTTLRAQVGQMNLQETVSSQSKINQALLKELDKATEPWGVKVIRVEVQEIKVSEELRRAMEGERIAETNRQAAVLETKATVESIERISKALQAQPNANAVMRYLLTQRYVEANYELGKSDNSKIIFMDPKALTEAITDLIGGDRNEGITGSSKEN